MTMTVKYLRAALVASVLYACTPIKGNPATEPSVFDAPWINGREKTEPTLQAQHYDENTVVIRQSLRTNFEAPFMYLIFGTESALLIDSGAGSVNLRSLVDQKVKDWLNKMGRESLSLIVMHTHSHADHVAADEQFRDREDTAVVGHKVNDVVDFFQFENWPNSSTSLDLGERIVDIIPTPGHHDTHLMIYDRATRILFSGDVIYPGRLYFPCGSAREFTNSIDRLADFIATRPVDWIFGAHIELSNKPGKMYDSNDIARADERRLEMSPNSITAIQIALRGMGDVPRVLPHDEFVLFPYPPDPRRKSPPDWCRPALRPN
ncbi:MAG: MBL fold metallo-hydrolase [Pseudomonadota bacterium]